MFFNKITVSLLYVSYRLIIASSLNVLLFLICFSTTRQVTSDPIFVLTGNILSERETEVS